MRRILFLARAEVLHIVRDRATLAQVLVLPVLQLLDPVERRDLRDPQHADLRRRLRSGRAPHGGWSRGSTRPATSGSSGSRRRSTRRTKALLRGDGHAGRSIIPHDFESSVVRERSAAGPARGERGKGSAAGIVQSYAMQILTTYAAELGTTFHPSTITVRSGDAEPAPRRRGGADRCPGAAAATTETLNYQHYMVPGLLVALVTMIGTLLSAQNIAREKELGTLEQLNVTPLTRGQFIAAKLLPFWVLGLVDLGIGLVARTRRLRRADARQPAAAPRHGGHLPDRRALRSGSGFRRWSRRSSRRCSSRSSS